MPLSPGTKLGPYEIESPLGAGGMGEVYKARDTRLDRTVAVKVLPGHLSDRPDLKERFDREAKAISSLSHPNICALYDVGHEAGVDFLVMEYLEGETLGDRIEREGLPTDQVLKLGTQVAEALDRAHRTGVVHRDLKPGNIMLTREGVKLLDFGLAKLGDLSAQPGSGSLPGLTAMPTATPSTPLTQEGTLLGTFQYMSPEQLEGKEADTRSDIFALGAVLYEMATGKKAFTGDSQASLIASILKEEPPPISEIASVSPPAFDRVVKTCLAKDPENRWQTAHDVALQLQWIEEGGSQAGVPAPVAARRRSRERFAWMSAAVGFAGVIALGALLVLNQAEPPESQVLRYTIDLPAGISGFGGPRISPDGRMLSFMATDSTGTRSIWVHRLNSLQAQPLPGTEDSETPFWSPDSRYLAYFATSGRLKKISVSGGPPQTIAVMNGADGSWGTGGMIVFDNGPTDSVMAVPSSGGTQVPATTIDRTISGTGAGWPMFLPDGEQFLYMNLGSSEEETRLMAGKLGSFEHRILGQVDSRFEYASSGHLLFVRDGILLAQPFDPEKAEFAGEPVPVSEGVSGGGVLFEGDFSVSNNGILVYWEGNLGFDNQMAWMDRDGNEIETLGAPGALGLGALSPDENHLIIAVNDDLANTNDLWILDLVRGTTSRFTFDPGADGAPVWSPDGERVVFGSARGVGTFGIYEKAANGAGNATAFLATDSPELPTDWSRDGNWVAFNRFAGASRMDLLAISTSGEGEEIPIANTNFFERWGAISPDGRWIAYQSDESGTQEIYVQAFPEAQGKWQISTSGGTEPQWRADGTELFYLEGGDRLMAVDMQTEAGFHAGTPRALFTSNFTTNGFAHNYLPASDGSRFLVTRPIGARTTSPIQVVVNWAAELEQP